MGLFDYLSMVGTHDYRNIANDEIGNDIVIDTSRVPDGTQPIETGIFHPEYRDGKCIVVEAYDTVEEAKKGHEKWVKILTTEPLPDELIDVPNAEITKLYLEWGGDNHFPRVRKTVDGAQ